MEEKPRGGAAAVLCPYVTKTLTETSERDGGGAALQHLLDY